MASISNRPNGHRWIQFTGPNKKRQTIRLGKVSKREAEDFRSRVEQLLLSRELNAQLTIYMQRWVAGLSDTMHQKLSNYGLFEPRNYRTLNELLPAWEADCDWSDHTKDIMQPFFKNMQTYFGGSKSLTSIMETDASEFRRWLCREGSSKGGTLARATVSRRIRWARQLFLFAKRKNAMASNPFQSQKNFNEVNRSRDFFVKRELAEQVLEQTDNLEFKTIIALVRYGAVRCPSEVLPFEWEQVNWEVNTMVVKAPKTERHKDQDQRTVPIFPELQKHLDALRETAKPGELRLFPNHQVTNAALTGKLERICRQLGEPLWKKPWQNMRATRETEWLHEHPIHVVASWMGHSPTIALKHYAQVETTQAAKSAAQAAQEEYTPSALNNVTTNSTVTHDERC